MRSCGHFDQITRGDGSDLISLIPNLPYKSGERILEYYERCQILIQILVKWIGQVHFMYESIFESFVCLKREKLKKGGYVDYIEKFYTKIKS